MTPEPALNPYARYLAGDDPIQVIEQTPANYTRLLSAVDDAQLSREPAPGKWSIRDILCHLADTELAFGFRLRQTVAEADHVIQPFNQEKFCAVYPNLDARDALNAFSAIRRWNVSFIRAVVPGALSKTVTHPERGTMTFQTIVETMAGHDRNHFRQVEALAAAQS